MLRTFDAMRLASAKLRTRKVRLAMTILLTGVMFGVLALGLTVGQAASDSFRRFSSGGMSERYLVSYLPSPKVNWPSLHDPSSELKQKVTDLHDKTIANKKAYARELGIPYDEKSEPEVIRYLYEGDSGSLNYANPAVNSIIDEMRNNVTFYPIARRNADAGKLGATHTYQPSQLVTKNGQLQPMIEGRELFSEKESQAQSKEPTNTLGENLKQPLALIDEALLDSYLLETRPMDLEGAIPLVVRYSDAEKLLGLEPLKPDATSQKQIERIQELRQRASQIDFSVCYRNAASLGLLQTAITQREQIASDKKKFPGNFVEPSLTYTLPSSDSCGPVFIAKDTRSSSEKQLEAKQKLFAARFSPKTAVEPIQTKIQFRVVGLMPNMPDFSGGLKGMLASLMGGQLSYTWIVPEQSFAASARHQELRSTIFEAVPNDEKAIASQPSIYEFASADAARNYMKSVKCDQDGQPSDHCPKDYGTLLQPVGSNSLTLDEIRAQATPFVVYAFIGTVAIAAFILMLTISRTIADSRRESAVFRALGATRLAISQIYLAYTLFLAGCIALFVVVVSLISAATLDGRFSSVLTDTARAIIAPRDLALEFRLFTIDLRILLSVVAAVVAAALIASILPLLRNMRRNPINDMRDE